MKLRAWLCLVFVLIASARARAQGAVDAATLLARMTDLASLSRFPDPPFETRQASSYDRASTFAGAPGWFANGDAGQFVRAQTRAGRTEQVLMETEAPGAIVRFWSANPAGTLRIYFDGQQTPAVTAPMAEFLDGQSWQVPDPLAAVRARGHNLYLPIPFARGCKITCENPGPLYYLIDYRVYPAGTAVSTWTEPPRAAIARAAAALRAPRSQGVAPEKIARFGAVVAPGARVEMARFSGARAFTGLQMRVARGTSEAALRALVLRVWFDDELCIEAPLGDFFGTAPGLNPFQSLPLGIAADGTMQNRWVMPFRRRARLELTNMGDKSVEVRGAIGLRTRAWTPSSLHFHASYRAWSELNTRPFRDLHLLDARGRGVWVGLAYSIDNPTRWWWGEGDEKITRDGAAFPTWFGTGTEDYFGYAWSSPQPFEHAFINQTRAQGPDNYGRFSVNRFQIGDAIPFDNALKFDIELWHHREVRVNLATVAYWYGAPAARDVGATKLDARAVRVAPMPPYQPTRVAGALEGESLPVLARSGGQTEVQSLAELSDDRQLWWRDGAVGDVLKLGFAAPVAGRYRVWLRRVKAPDYGIMALQINGQSAGAPLDGYAPGIESAPEAALGEFDLKAVDNQLEIKIVGRNAAAVPRLMFGLYYLRLERV